MDEASRRIDLGTHSLRIRESGAGEHAYVLLHDFLDGPAVWQPLAAGLAERARVVAVQQRGHGDSTAPPGPCRPEDLAADVRGVLDALDVARATLVGHGLGGVAALATALADPGRVAALVLIATPIECDAAGARRWADVVRGGEVNKLQGLARSMWGPMSRREVEGDGVALTELARLLQGLQGEPLTPRLGAVACPTLVIAGEEAADGSFASARAVAERIPGARLARIAGANAAPHVEQPGAVVAEIRALAG